uniref:Fatty acid amide hydrolase n=1 Tax=Phallusia mammillata TaxID=59560 RepID=A0A6F9DNA3_9ASCI|nr:fatty acid amide hydrolase [Phallusia mammillata]
MEFLLTLIISSVVLWFVFLRRHGRGPRAYICRKQNCYDDKSYKKKFIQVPIMRGFKLKLLTKLMSSLFGNIWLVKYINAEAEFFDFRRTSFEELPTFYPTAYLQVKHDDEKSFTHADVENLIHGSQKSENFKFVSMSQILSHYKNGTITPSQLAEKTLRILGRMRKYNIIVDFDAENLKKMAAASTDRYRDKRTLSPIDGIFVVIKDEYPATGLTCSSGTTFIGRNSCKEDCAMVARLRELGAIVFAVANMHEFGLGTNGNNVNKGYGRCHNPYNENHFTGGSSSGSAAAVASGIVPVALGTDGGGSIRIPSSYCGVVGLKPTFGRLSSAKMHSHANTVSHCGPICGNVRDTAAMFSLLAGADQRFPEGTNQPKVILPKLKENLDGLKIGIDRRFFEDCTEEVLEHCNRALHHLERSGAEIVDLEIAELNECSVAHRITILSEMTTSAQKDYDNHYDEWTLPNRMLFEMGNHITAVDYVQANKQRTRMLGIIREVFEQVDVIVTPTCAHAAPKVHPGDVKYGAANANQDTMNMRFSTLGNFTGIPGISIPVGYNDSNLPIGFQIMASWWREDLIFQVAEYLENKIKLKRPSVYFNLVDE